MTTATWKRRSLEISRRSAWKLRPPTLALGGGGARGFAHIGVLMELDRVRLPVRAIAGTSMGAVVGAMYGALGSAKAVHERWREALARDLIPDARGPNRRKDDEMSENPLLQAARRFRNRLVVSFALHKTTILDDDPLIEALNFLLPDVALEDLKPRMTAVATDLESGHEVRLTHGSLRRAIKASSAIPGVLPAVTIDDRVLVDGGVAAEIPVRAARSLGLPVMAVDVSMDLPPLSEKDIALDTMTRGQAMTARLLRRQHLEKARWTVRPEVGHAVWSDWQEFETLVEAGSAAVRSWIEGRS